MPVPRLKKLREGAFLTQADLSQRSRVAETTIVRLEQGRSPARFSTIRKLAGALGIAPEELVEATTGPEGIERMTSLDELMAAASQAADRIIEDTLRVKGLDRDSAEGIAVVATIRERASSKRWMTRAALAARDSLDSDLLSTARRLGLIVNVEKETIGVPRRWVVPSEAVIEADEDPQLARALIEIVTRQEA
jgi:transcriptional regulator with XRE-family HTH domain